MLSKYRTGKGKKLRYASELTNCMDCGALIGKQYSLKGAPQRCQKCRKTFELLNPEQNPAYRTGKSLDGNGYVTVIARGHPFCKRNGRMVEHRLVIEKHIGRYLKPSEQVHHLNGKRDDNRLCNLVLCQTQKEHYRYHTRPPCMICSKPHAARGFCRLHYSKWFFAGSQPKGLYDNGKWFKPLPSHQKDYVRLLCMICGKPNQARGLCNSHFHQWRSAGYPPKGVCENGKWFKPFPSSGRGKVANKSS